jgi:signal transduction histidine kinase
MTQARLAASGSTALPTGVDVTTLAPHWARLAQRTWILLFVINLGFIVVGLPFAYQTRLTPCPYSGYMCISGQLNAAQYAIAQAEGLSIPVIAAVMTAFGMTDLIGMSLVGGILIWRKPNDLAAVGMAYVGLTCALGNSDGFGAFRQVSPLAWSAILLVWSINGFLRPLLMCIIPDGQFRPRWVVLPALGCSLALAYIILFRHFEPVVGGSYDRVVNIETLITLFVLLYRYRHIPEQRQQMKWILSGTAVFCAVMIVFVGLSSVIPVLSQPDHPIAYTTRLSLFIVMRSFVFLMILIAILRFRLFDIDLLINRTLVYGALTLMIMAVYMLIVGGLGSLLQAQSSLPLSLLATGILAAAFQPMRMQVQRSVNRLMFGKRDEPLAVLDDLAKHLEIVVTPRNMLTSIVDLTRRTLKLPYVAIEVDAATGQSMPTIIDCGQPAGSLVTFPLIYHGQRVGALLASPRSPGEILNPADRTVLENVARQTSAAIYAARLTQALQHSRQHIITTREEERRRLRRDLHDGLGPALATLTLQAEAARDLIPSNPQRSAELMGEIIGGAQAAIQEIRRVAYALRPPALDDLGLITALREYIAQIPRGGPQQFQISLDAPDVLPPLPAAVEVAVYRIAQESLTNVVRHAQATSCGLRLAVGEEVELEIWDDGRGIPEACRAGVGLRAIHERTAELGGSCVIDSAPGRGTRLTVRLPLTD